MRIGLIGGVERNEVLYQRVAAAAGHEVEFHGGHMGGRGCASLEAVVDRADLVVIVTDINSHGAVQVARQAVRRRRIPSLIVKRCGIARFTMLLQALDTKSARSAA